MLDTLFERNVKIILTRPMAKLCQMMRISANIITTMALLSGFLALIFLFFHCQWYAFIALMFSGYCDMLDGEVARLSSSQGTRFGTVFDIFSDRCVEFLIIWGLFLYDPHGRAHIAILMLGSVLLCVTSFLVVGIMTENSSKKGFYYSPGFMERTDAFIFFSLMILLPFLYTALGLMFSILVAVTGFIRVYEFYKNEQEAIIQRLLELHP